MYQGRSYNLVYVRAEDVVSNVQFVTVYHCVWLNVIKCRFIYILQSNAFQNTVGNFHNGKEMRMSQ